MYKEVIDKIRPEMEKAVNFLRKKLTEIRTGRASPSLVENIVVDYFGQRLPLKQLAAISLVGSRQILIQPWDNSYLESIEKAIAQSEMKLSTSVDKEGVRVNLPPLTEEIKKNMLRVISSIEEDSKRTVRHWREEAWSEIQKGSRAGDISEDDKYRAKDKLQELTDEYNNKIEDISEGKKKEMKEG